VFPFICPTSYKEKIPWPLANLEMKAKYGRYDFAKYVQGCCVEIATGFEKNHTRIL
jgi:hypothetical protein